MNRRIAAFLAVPALALVFVLLLVRCGDNPEDALLDPSGSTTAAEGVITGILDWGMDPPYPPTLVFAIPYYDPSCTGGPTSIHITGEYNNWNETVWETEPGMTELFPCLWHQKLELAADDNFEWKFVTNAAWDGSYAAGGSGVDETARRGTTTNLNGDNLIVSIPSADTYWFLLNASVDPALFMIPTADEVPWDSTGTDSSRFTISNLEAAPYTLIIWVPDREDEFPVRYVRGIRVSGDAGVDLGTVSVVLTGEIRGVIAFDDAPATTPAAEVYVSISGSGAPVDTVRLASGETQFSITGLNEDTYNLRIHTTSYVDTLIEDVEFTLGETEDLGTITLARGGAARGVVAFQDDPDVKPVATVYYEDPATLLRFSWAAADPEDGSYVLDGLPAGLVEIGFDARKYRDTTLTDVSITVAETTDVGTVVLQPGCVSVAQTIHMLGTFNSWNEALLTSDPGMNQTESCLWRDTIDIYPVHSPYVEFKFVTDGAYTTPPDYVLCEDRLEEYDSLFGPVCLGEGANPQNLVMLGTSIPGVYEVVLDEDSLQFRAFVLEEFTGGVQGTITFDTGLEPPYPPVTVDVKRAGETTLLGSVDVDEETGAFSLVGFDTGTYDIGFSGTAFRDTTLSAVAITGGQTTNLGTVELLEVTCESEFTVIRVVGDFNGWSTSGPGMTQIEPCLWVDTLSAGTGASS